MVQFTSEQLQAIDSGQPVSVSVEGRQCVLISDSLYEQFRAAINDWNPAQLKWHMSQMMADDWNDPAMCVYGD
jgi:hypothetical protein